MTRIHRAGWILPIDGPPIRNGSVEVRDDVIVGVGAARGEVAGDERRTAILPALVNAHTHLELSWMRGRVPPGDAMPRWAMRLIGERMSQPPVEERLSAVRAAIADARAAGTTLVGDVSNTLEAWTALAESELSAVTFYELIGFRAPEPEALARSATEALQALPPAPRLRATIAPHAPYSVSPGLFRAIARGSDSGPLSVHLGESPEEVEFLAGGSGPWREVLERLGAWNPDWQVPRCGPVAYMAQFGLLNDRLLAVHGVQFTDDELRRLAEGGATIVTCPRSNRWTGAGTAPVARFYDSGVRVALGTDSLASVDDLNLFAEMAEVRRLAPRVPAGRILRSATLDGADALGFGSELGSITPGKRAELLVVRIPPDVVDVEEYLVAGVAAADVGWLRQP